MRKIAELNNIFVDHINGYEDHCHCLISMKSTHAMEWVMKILKGESSHWINETKLCPEKFEWQDDYYAASVSPNMIDKVRAYIRNQESHHSNKNFKTEMEEMSGMIHFRSPPEDGGS